MNKHYLILLIILAFLIPVCHAAGAEKSLEMVSLSADTHINEAVQILETYTLKSVNKKMINLSGYNGTINIPINNLPWDRALELILLQNKLIQKDHPGFISIEDIPVIKTDAIVPPILKPYLPKPSWCGSKPSPCWWIEPTSKLWGSTGPPCLMARCW